MKYDEEYNVEIFSCTNKGGGVGFEVGCCSVINLFFFNEFFHSLLLPTNSNVLFTTQHILYII